MTLDEAHTEAVCGGRMTAVHLSPSVCLVYDPKYEWRRFRREWPNGDGCEFLATDEDKAADWYELPAVEPEPAPVNVGFVPGPGTPPTILTGKMAGPNVTIVLPPSSAPKWGSPCEKPSPAAQDVHPSPPPAKDAWGRPIG